MTRVVIVGDAYLADLSVGGGPIIPGPGQPPQPPLGIWGGGNVPYPTPPIYYPGAPGGGGGGQPQPPLGIWGGPWQPPYPSHGLPPFATQLPVFPPQGGGGGGGQPQPPLGIWGGPWQPPYPSQGPGFPTNPIVLPPPPGSGQPPIAVQLPVFPPEATHPIVLPPEVAPPTMPDGRPIEWKTAWTPATGWIVIGVPNVPVPTPAS